MDYVPVVAGFVPAIETVELKSDLEIAMGNLMYVMVNEKQKAWKEGFAAAVSQMAKEPSHE